MMAPAGLPPPLGPPGTPIEPLAALRDAYFAEVAANAFAYSPYLRRLGTRHLAALAALGGQGAGALARAAQGAGAAPALTGAIAAANGDVGQGLRRAKAVMHLFVALADLAGEMDLAGVTGALSAFADSATALALAAAGHRIGREAVPGFFVLGLGKLGANLLNYSSDIDICFYYERALCPLTAAETVKLAQSVTDLLARHDADGYVARVDLRLRPDPSAHAIALSTESAEHYFESFGQNWERAAYLKARPIAGDIAAAERFLTALTPFLWRRHLDHAAIADIHSIKRQINAQGGHRALSPGFDVKLGRGGIREIEFFCEVPQLILGGRDESLRVRDTLSALTALSARGAIEAEAAEELRASYGFFRALEHRAQMIEDAQTHRIPEDSVARAGFARFCGFADPAAFDATTFAARRRVQIHYSALFPEEEDLFDPNGSLVFTGVAPDPETVETLRLMGFSTAPAIAAAIMDWHRGRLRATRSPRAREALTYFAPKLLRALAASGEPDHAFRRFEDFFARLASGAQVMAMLNANPGLLRGLCLVLGLAPALALQLARRPALLDAMIDARFHQPLAEEASAARRERLCAAMSPRPQDPFEEAMNRARPIAQEERFRIGYQLLSGATDVAAAGEAYCDTAEASVIAMAELASRELAERLGPAPGVWAVAALGKLGSRELSEGGDLDLMVIYDAPAAQLSAASEYYAKFAHRLVSALSAPTANGVLYPIDMQLRPSGKAGPVAVRRAAFDRYYAHEAWTWELLALTRFRAVAGDHVLMAELMASKNAILGAPRDRDAVIADVQAMRAKLAGEHAHCGFWDLKYSPGGLVDLEFLVEIDLLTGRAPLACDGNVGRTLARALATASGAEREDLAALAEAYALFTGLTRILRVAAADVFDPLSAPAGLWTRLAAEAGIAREGDLTRVLGERLTSARAAVLAIGRRAYGY